MGTLIVGDIILLFFSIYVGIFFRKFYTPYPKMEVGFHIWEVCYNEKTWIYGNKFAGNISIILGLIIFALIYPLLLYIKLSVNILILIFVIFICLYFILLFQIVRRHMRKKFNLKDDKKD